MACAVRHQHLPSLALQLDLHGLHVEEALERLEHHLVTLGGLGSPGGILLQVKPPRITCHIGQYTVLPALLPQAAPYH